jgi:hypothetical protein
VLGHAMAMVSTVKVCDSWAVMAVRSMMSGWVGRLFGPDAKRLCERIDHEGGGVSEMIISVC